MTISTFLLSNSIFQVIGVVREICNAERLVCINSIHQHTALGCHGLVQYPDLNIIYISCSRHNRILSIEGTARL